MEVRETAACGIAERKFAIECQPEDLPHIYRIIRYPGAEDGYYDEEFLDDLLSQMAYICGDEITVAAADDVDTSLIQWSVEDDVYALMFNELATPVLYQLFDACLERKPHFDAALARRLMVEASELAPSILSNLPVINR